MTGRARRDDRIYSVADLRFRTLASGIVDKSSQLDLFGSPRPQGSRAETAVRERLEREHGETAEIAARLPGNVFFGTSSWGFPGWAGIVYSRRATPGQLAREGLAEYARHPLLTTVGIDRGFYAPIPEADLLRSTGSSRPTSRCGG